MVQSVPPARMRGGRRSRTEGAAAASEPVRWSRLKERPPRPEGRTPESSSPTAAEPLPHQLRPTARTTTSSCAPRTAARASARCAGLRPAGHSLRPTARTSCRASLVPSGGITTPAGARGGYGRSRTHPAPLRHAQTSGDRRPSARASFSGARPTTGRSGRCGATPPNWTNSVPPSISSLMRQPCRTTASLGTRARSRRNTGRPAAPMSRGGRPVAGGLLRVSRPTPAPRRPWRRPESRPPTGRWLSRP